MPQLDLKVKYAPRACAILHGCELEHFEPPRWFIVSTNHKECQNNALRNLGRAPPLPLAKKGRKRTHEEMGEESDIVFAQVSLRDYPSNPALMQMMPNRWSGPMRERLNWPEMLLYSAGTAELSFLGLIGWWSFEG